MQMQKQNLVKNLKSKDFLHLRLSVSENMSQQHRLALAIISVAESGLYVTIPSCKMANTPSTTRVATQWRALSSSRRCSSHPALWRACNLISTAACFLSSCARQSSREPACAGIAADLLGCATDPFLAGFRSTSRAPRAAPASAWEGVETCMRLPFSLSTSFSPSLSLRFARSCAPPLPLPSSFRPPSSLLPSYLPPPRLPALYTSSYLPHTSLLPSSFLPPTFPFPAGAGSGT
jgi:hypothetical protein